VRIPCAFNGLVGLKVTFGRHRPARHHAAQLDAHSIGPMARSVEDCALLLNALAAPDPRDPTTPASRWRISPPQPRAARSEGMRIAVPDSKQLPDFMHHDVVQACRRRHAHREPRRTVEAVRLPSWFFEMAQAAGIISTSEMFSLHRAWIETRASRSARGCAPCVVGKSFLTGRLSEELRRMGQRRAEFNDGCSLTMRCWPRQSPCRAIRCRRSRRPRPSGLPDAARHYLGLCGLSLPSGFSGGLPLASRSSAALRDANVLRLARPSRRDDFHRLGPDLASLASALRHALRHDSLDIEASSASYW